MKYTVKAHETIYYELDVEANSSDEALAKVKAGSVFDWLGHETDESDWVIDGATEVISN